MAEREGEMRRNVSRLACSLVFVFAASAADAVTVDFGPVFPAPGGTSFTPAPTGSIGQFGGGTPTWSSIDLSATDQLWWGPTSVQLGYRVGSTDFLSTLNTLDPNTPFGGSIERWLGTVTLPNGGNPVTRDARFTATILNGASNWIDPS